MSTSELKNDARKLALPVTVVASLVAAALGAGGSWAMSKAKLEEHGKAIEEHRQQLEKHGEQINAHEVTLGRVDVKLGDIKDSLERIEKQMGTK